MEGLIIIAYLIGVVVAFRFIKNTVLEDRKELTKHLYWEIVKPRVILYALCSWAIFPIAITIGIIRLIYKNL